MNAQKAEQNLNEGFKSGSPEAEYVGTQRKRIMFLVSMCIILFFSFIAALSIGAIDIPFFETTKIVLNNFMFGLFGAPEQEYYETTIMTLRMPRILLCLITGASLGMAGAIMQGVLRNPLVSPFTLGVSTAASFGAAIAIVLGSAILGGSYYAAISLFGLSFTLDQLIKTVFAFIFGMSSIFLVVVLARNTTISRSTIILSGVIISYIFQAGLMFMKYISDDTQLRDITMWIMGGFSGTTWSTIAIVLPIVIIGGIYLEKLSIDINMLASGDDVASNLGINVQKLRNNGMIVSTLITTVCLAFTGTIGFVGLMAPHICRMLIGNDARFLLPASALFGAIILVLSDLFARIVLRPSELPVGIIMYVIGGAFFIWLVFGKKVGGST